MPASFILKINGKDASEDFMGNVLSVEVDLSLYLPGMFAIHLYDAGLELIDSADLDLGKPVTIRAETDELWDQPGVVAGELIQGEITAIEPRFPSDGNATLVVRGYDRSHRLTRGTKTRTFLEKKDSDIVQTLAGEADLTPEVDATTVTHDWVLQENETNWDFLLRLARRSDRRVLISEGKLYFEKDLPLGQAGDLEYGLNLAEFDVRMTGAGQTDKRVVHGWDPKGKQPVESQVLPDSGEKVGGMTNTGGDAAKTAFGPAELHVVDRAVFTPDEAKAVAESVGHEVDRAFVQGECSSRVGDPRLRAGAKVVIKGVGTRFSGTYGVTRALHRWQRGDYRTEFTVSSRHLTLGELVGSPGHNGSRSRGAMIGQVTNLDDPDDLGRVKVKYPWLGDEIESDWVRVVAPGVGSERGLLWLPEVNDEVAVIFENNDVRRPIMLGGLWSSMDKPPLPNSECVGGGGLDKKGLWSKTWNVLLDDTHGGESLLIANRDNDISVKLDLASKTVTICSGGDVSVEADGKVTIKGGGDLSLEGNKVTIKAQTDVSLEATANMNIEGKVQTKIQGKAVGVNGTAMTEIKGGLVKIN